MEKNILSYFAFTSLDSCNFINPDRSSADNPLLLVNIWSFLSAHNLPVNFSSFVPGRIDHLLFLWTSAMWKLHQHFYQPQEPTGEELVCSGLIFLDLVKTWLNDSWFLFYLWFSLERRVYGGFFLLILMCSMFLPHGIFIRWFFLTYWIFKIVEFKSLTWQTSL